MKSLIISDTIVVLNEVKDRMNDPEYYISLIECTLALTALEEMCSYYPPSFFLDEEIRMIEELHTLVITHMMEKNYEV